MQRREFLLTSASLPLLFKGAPLLAATTERFGDDTVPAMARALAARPWSAPSQALPRWLQGIDYDQYRQLRFKPEAALWRGSGLPWEAQFFHRGFYFKDRVDIHTVERSAGGAQRDTRVDYRPQMFETGELHATRDPALGFAGFRLHAPLNNPDYLDEVCVFLGASYFRAVARGLNYGLSARGLALGSGDPEPEEFPLFTTFWLEKPASGSGSMVVHALMDSPSATGAYRFVIAPGDETLVDVDARLYPRKDIHNAGIAPLTSMFEFDAGDRVGVDDFRPAVHDSDGLAVFNGAGEQLWRALANPNAIQHSGLQDENPRGFGLMQRKRQFADFEDAEARYETRPSAWVEPLHEWGRGEVHLVELPTNDEYHDNIVAFWRPREPLRAGAEHRFRYRLHWCAEHVWQPQLAHVAATRVGEHYGARHYVIDLKDGTLAGLPADAELRIEASASSGELNNPVIYRLPPTEGAHWRLSFEFTPQTGSAAELRARVTDTRGAPLSETWLSRWSA